MLPYEFEWIQECASTSRLLKDQGAFAQGKVQVIAAAKQTAGTGRLGRSWVGAEGNLHFSIRIPAQFISEDIKTLVPLAAGVVVAQFIRSHFGINLCLKWPNDLLLEGRKIGGILCEATILESRLQGVVIGVGLNLTTAPEQSQGLEYPAGVLKPLHGFEVGTAETLARNLAQYFARRWLELSRTNVMSEWNFFAMTHGHLWYRNLVDGYEWYRMVGIQEDGHLSLDSRQLGQSLIVNSSSHEFKWDLQMGRRMLVADVGNTRTKVGTVIVGSDGTLSLDSIASDAESVELFVKSRVEQGFAPVIHCLSVNPAGMTALVDRFRPLQVDVRALEKKPIRLTNSNYNFESLGADRGAILEMLYYKQSRGDFFWPAMVVSCGTATTIDCVDANGCHVGGYIMAGVQTAIDAICQRGALLPKFLDVFASQATSGWPSDSDSAIVAASVASTAAFIKSERERLAEQAAIPGACVPLLITGGYAKLVCSKLGDESVQLDEHLVLCGAALMALNGR